MCIRDSISDNCDSVLFLSGRGKNAKEIADALGKETIDSFNTSENRGSQTSHGMNYQKLGKALMSEDEITIMDGGRCILQLRGVRPFFSEKFDITKHPHYKYLADADKKNTFEVDRFLSTLRRKRQQVVAQDESFALYDIELSDEDATAEMFIRDRTEPTKPTLFLCFKDGASSLPAPDRNTVGNGTTV